MMLKPEKVASRSAKNPAQRYGGSSVITKKLGYNVQICDED
jgi:hypothetical protein